MFIPMFTPSRLFFSLTVVAWFIHWRLKDHNSNCPMCYSHIFPSFYHVLSPFWKSFRSPIRWWSIRLPPKSSTTWSILDFPWNKPKLFLCLEDFHLDFPWKKPRKSMAILGTICPWNSPVSSLAIQGPGQARAPPWQWPSFGAARTPSVSLWLWPRRKQRGSRKNMGRCSEDVGNM